MEEGSAISASDDRFSEPPPCGGGDVPAGAPLEGGAPQAPPSKGGRLWGPRHPRVGVASPSGCRTYRVVPDPSGKTLAQPEAALGFCEGGSGGAEPPPVRRIYR